jgi:uncharacterized membrane protein
VALIDALRLLHVVGAAVLLGTGAGIAFFMVMANRTGKPALVAHTLGVVVIADAVFTTSAVILQPITGFLLAHIVGWRLTDGWLMVSMGLYVVTGLCWLPVVWIQIRLRELARQAEREATPLSEEYHRLFAKWFALGIPAFVSVLAIVWLMLAKPQFRLFA